MTDSQREQRRTALAISGGVCEVCGKPLGAYAQAAHRIANTEPNRRKWGAWIIDSPLNVGYTCSLECNQSLNIGMDKGACLELVQKILRYEKNYSRLWKQRHSAHRNSTETSTQVRTRLKAYCGKK